jgi:hypothetical protein
MFCGLFKEFECEDVVVAITIIICHHVDEKNGKELSFPAFRHFGSEIFETWIILFAQNVINKNEK